MGLLHKNKNADTAYVAPAANAPPAGYNNTAAPGAMHSNQPIAHDPAYTGHNPNLAPNQQHHPVPASHVGNTHGNVPAGQTYVDQHGQQTYVDPNGQTHNQSKGGLSGLLHRNKDDHTATNGNHHAGNHSIVGEIKAEEQRLQNELAMHEERKKHARGQAKAEQEEAERRVQAAKAELEAAKRASKDMKKL